MPVSSPKQFISEQMRSLVAESEARGAARGRARDLLIVLEARNVAVPEPARQEFLACTDHAQLDAWLTRAATADTVGEVTGRR